jgi:carbonic anhydrase
MTEHFIHGHFQFAKRYFGEREYLATLAKKQAPRALYIGCSDSRVVPELLTSAVPGDLFVLRNIANYVPTLEHPDASVGAAIDFAVAHLGVPDIIVCGHSGCGGVRAALDGLVGIGPETPSLREWLTGLLPAVESVKGAGLDPEATFRAAVEENVLQALANLLTYPSVRARLDAGELRLHGWVYDMHSLALTVFDSEHNEFVDVAELAPESV